MLIRIFESIILPSSFKSVKISLSFEHQYSMFPFLPIQIFFTQFHTKSFFFKDKYPLQSANTQIIFAFNCQQINELLYLFNFDDFQIRIYYLRIIFQYSMSYQKFRFQIRKDLLPLLLGQQTLFPFVLSQIFSNYCFYDFFTILRILQAEVAKINKAHYKDQCYDQLILIIIFTLLCFLTFFDPIYILTVIILALWLSLFG